MKLLSKRAALLGMSFLVTGAIASGAQTLATGDSRTVVEPTFPVSCTVLTAQQAIVSGGPASETTFDTTRIQTALTACASGQAVELAGSGSNFAFLTAPLNLPTGVSLIVDGGVTLFASRNPVDYQISGAETCGSYGSTGAGCNNLFKFANGSTNANSGLYGYGVIDGRGGSTMLTSTGADTGISWWQNADTATTAGKAQDNFVFMKPNKSTNLTLYKITLRNSPMFHVVTSNVSGMTVWGVKIQAPFSAHNTDGIDPQGTNVTITNTSISDGDDDVAVSASSASSNITVSNVTTYSGHGISVGSYTNGGLNNMLVKNVNMAGTAADGNSIALRLKSAADRGGVVQNVTYQNVCIRDTRYPIVLTGYYNTNSGTLIPTFTNIVYQGVHALPPTATTYPYKLQFQGYDANHLSTVTFSNVSIETLLSTNVTGTTTPTPDYTTFALANNVYPTFLTTLTGTGINETGASTSNVAANTGDCTATSTIFPYIVGELFATTAAATNLQSATVASGSTVTLNAMVQPAMSQASYSGTAGNSVGAAALTAGVNFYLGATKVGTGTLSTTSNGTVASLTLTSPAAGTYTAQYQGDANYPAITFGSVNITVPVGTTTSTALAINPATITYGGYPTLTSTVTATSGTPVGTISYSEGSKTYSGGTLSAGTAANTATASTNSILFAAGTHTLTSTYSGSGTFSTSSSAAMTLLVNQATTTTAVSASPTTVTANGTTTLSVTVTGSSNTAAAYPTGSVSFADGATSLGSVNLGSTGSASLLVTLTLSGSRTITATYSGDANYMASGGNTMVTVNSASSSTVLTAPSPFVYGTLPTLSATVTANSGNPSGSVAFYDGTTLLGSGPVTSGVATFTLTTYLIGGAHTLNAIYSGDTTFGTSSGMAGTTVTTASSMTSLMASASSVSAGGQVTLTVTVTGVPGAASPSGKVTFADNGTTLGMVNLSGGTAMYPATLATAGSRTLTATYAGDGNYAGSTGSTPETVNTLATTTTISPTSATTLSGATVTFTATVTSGTTPVTSGIVTFYNGTSMLGTGMLGTAGTATYVLTTGAIGTTYSVTAAFTASGNYAGSMSGAAAVVVGAPFTFSANPTSLSIAAGSSGSTSLTVTPTSGFTGALLLACNSPVSYVKCSVASSSLTLSGTTPQTVTATITVAATTSALRLPGDGAKGIVLALLMPAGLFGLLGATRRRKWLRGVALAGIVCAVSFGVTGCGGSSSSTTATSNKPTGSYTVAFTATAGGSTQTSNVTVNIQ